MSNNKIIYLIGFGAYSDAQVYHATFDKDKAEKYIAYKNMLDNDSYGHWWIEKVGIDDFEIGDVEGLKYGYLNTLIFDKNIKMTYYKCVKSYVKEDKVEVIPKQKFSTQDYIKVCFFSPEKISIEKANKIAYDMLAEYKARESGVTI